MNRQTQFSNNACTRTQTYNSVELSSLNPQLYSLAGGNVTAEAEMTPPYQAEEKGGGDKETRENANGREFQQAQGSKEDARDETERVDGLTERA